MTLSSVLVVALLAAPAQAAETLDVAAQLRFESGSATLTADSATALDAAAARTRAALEGGSFKRLRVEGHTDSVGEADANLQLSQQRAEAVAVALAERGVPKEAMEAIGFGEVRPIADDASEDGRRRNRRVELRLLKGEEADRTIATIARTFNSVERRPPQANTWAPAAVRDPLFEAWRLASKSRSSADLSFTRDRSELHVRENTVVVIFGPGDLISSTTGGRLLGKASLERGSLKSRLAELAGSDGGSVEVQTLAAVTDINKADVLVNVDGGGKTRVAHHGGEAARVRSTKKGAAKPTELAAGFGTAVENGKEPTPPAPLPPPPAALSAGAPGGAFVASADGTGTVSAQWQGSPDIVSYHVELMRDDVMLVDVVDILAPTTTFEARGLPPGNYRLFVSSVDRAGFEGLPSSPVALTISAPAPTKRAPVREPPSRVANVTEQPLPTTPAPTVRPEPGRVHGLWSVLPFAASAALAGGAAYLVVSNENADNNGAITALAGTSATMALVGVAVLMEAGAER